ncbi:N(4)-(beta-N-acetylglucosaminyl)-L-asparaginase [Streptococcus cuniculi]|uniref:N(4)-(Beta-N-acetylglucosaminyl)-L-asparaginase n=1 Tax=Streptococcus cuniculi TaxID=1432788 RepID=A0A1Q8EAV3_9STRE|nr:N(4)-(beta-N-acetylglucosaminyl)-L-asparaginase [Streptococcus cuniculi]OLF48926.1 N(4)-(beta-N-acetylglucosaminyl)-L-asparaginase [Streptococcus cuniculi]
MWGMIATWRMALEGVEQSRTLLANHQSAGDAIEEAIKAVEDFPYYKSVGYGGLPNEEMEVELDAAYMDGTSFDFGAVCALKDVANPISVARKLSKQAVNNVLVDQGAKAYAQKEGFEQKEMLTDRAKIHYHNRLVDMKQEQLVPYAGHDTVGMVALDAHGQMVAGTSTSGLFMKKKGRVGDSPFIGSGLYVDSQIGGASATGLGEDIMKGILSYEIVRLMKEGKHPQEACEIATFSLEQELIARRGQAGDISVVAMDHQGRWGSASTIDNFSFVVTTETEGTVVYRTKRDGQRMEHSVADQEWLDRYLADRMQPLVVRKEGEDE